MRVLIDRYHPGEDRAYQMEYVIDDYVAKGMTVMDLLVYITKNMDPTLAFYSHSVCNHGICKRCILKINGQPQLACTARVRDYESLHLSPANERQVIRDLVVCQGKER